MATCPICSLLGPCAAIAAHATLVPHTRAQGVPAGAVRAQVIEALQRVGMPAEMSRRPAGGYSGGCGVRPRSTQHQSPVLRSTTAAALQALSRLAAATSCGSHRSSHFAERTRVLCTSIPIINFSAAVEHSFDFVCLTPGMTAHRNKRKLSLAIALVGSPGAVLLDEPSSGMDPGARRAMWGAILAATAPAAERDASAAAEMDPEAGLVSAAAAGTASGGGREDGCAVVLTTHSMEEVEVLCSRVGIMHRGRLACLGSPQRLKALYGGACVHGHPASSRVVPCTECRAQGVDFP